MKQINKKIRLIKSKLKFNQRRLIILSIVLLVAGIVIGCILLSQQKWNNYSNNYNQQLNSMRSEIKDVVLQLSEKTDVSLGDKISEISQLQVSLSNESDVLCDVDPLIKWQSYIDQYYADINDCLQQKSHIKQLLSIVNKIVAYLKADQDLANIIASADVQTNANNQSDKWNQVEAFWRLASANALRLNDVYQFKDTKTAATSSLNSIADAWALLSQANNSQNKQQFNEAVAKLNISYTTLSTISTVSATQLDIIVSELTTLL